MTTKKRLWVTYAWADNRDQDVDYIISELEKSGELEVHFDRRQLPAGQRIWDNIASEIVNPERSDAYAVVVTADSLTSNPCQEELNYALDRALSTRGVAFPLIALIHKIEPRQMPAKLTTRLGVMLRDPNWVKQVVAAVNGQAYQVDLGNLGPLKMRVHRSPPGEKYVFALEIQPRLETINIWRACVNEAEKDRLKLFSVRPPNSAFGASAMFAVVDDIIGTTLGPMRTVGCDGSPLDHAHSLYLYFDSLPSALYFSRDGQRLDPIDLSSVKGLVP
ncbi:toll/interleukin-1 receptor domain-containing protein [Archangium primigenium]|uniref:toll/interleukin-1 receptor domain-containing protein n=1 Tax=[Archangium] primigenium TaxID=2792470 RepID=UPI00195850A6|nr:toll/interleukin-1 receptor domain-containing protein [Archangium primigenium]MBM7117646.1 toll/interleukin-1 receptor domain-containing protein [Archangium primigenium]